MKIPVYQPELLGNEKKYVIDAVDQGWVSTGGAYISKLEEDMSSFLEVDEVAACQSGTSAIHLALIDSGVSGNDIVLVPTLTFIAAVNPVVYQNAEPIFMDCDDSLCIDTNKIRIFCEEECTYTHGKLIHNKTGKHVKAIIVVHVFGNMADMEAIMDIASKYNLTVIEDATEALGTKYITGRYKDKYAGTIGNYGAYSFNGNKIITTGGGGAVTSSSADAVKHLRYLSTQAKDDPHYYIHNEIGYNYRMTNVQAAIGVAQLEELEEFIRRKNDNYEYYKKEFAGWKYGELMDFRNDILSNKWFYSVKLDISKAKKSLKTIITELQERNIQTRAIWGLINEQKPYEKCLAYHIEKAKYYSDRVINIPCSTQITRDEMKYVVDTMKEVIF